MAKYRKKPVVIEAVQFTGDNWSELVVWADVEAWKHEDWQPGDVAEAIMINTSEGQMLARKGDWIIRGVRGEFYPCKPDIFAAIYEPVEGSAWCGRRWDGLLKAPARIWTWLKATLETVDAP